jgi:hypothetical protein
VSEQHLCSLILLAQFSNKNAPQWLYRALKLCTVGY